MLDQIMGSLKGELSKTISEETGLDTSKAPEAIDLAKDTVQEGLMSELTSGNLGGLMDMFGSASKGGSDSLMNNSIVQNMAGQYVGSLINKMGVPADTANTIAKIALPMILKQVTGSAKGGTMDKDSLMEMLGGSEGITDKLTDGLKDQLMGGLGKKLGGFFK